MKIISISKALTLVKTTEKKQNTKLVQNIIDQVIKNGDSSLYEFEKKFNGVNIKNLQVSKKEIKDAYKLVSKDQINAITESKNRLLKTESILKKQLRKISFTIDGTKITKSFEPLKIIGCYVPGGLAQYPSSAIMSVTPAKLAGVGKIVVATPPNKQGRIEPIVLVAADICGADIILKIGGAHAIAALAVGTQSVPQVDKIVGPGGAFATTAKYLVSDIAAIDMLAGPTELVILADDSTNPRLVALDIISQAEHSSDTGCYIITTSQNFAKKVSAEIAKLLPSIPRKDIDRKSTRLNSSHTDISRMPSSA